MVDYLQNLMGAVAKSSLGFRPVETPRTTGGGAIAFYFEARKEGMDTVTLMIDDDEYAYEFTVKK